MADKELNQDLVILLSSYLDGELTAGQTEKVEKRLAEDAEARMLLGELQAVSMSLRKLPREAAPTDLADSVMQEFERDLLLDRDDVLSELAGQKHLRLLRFMTAAAMVMLTGAIATIVYLALRNPDTPKNPAADIPPIFASQTDGGVEASVLETNDEDASVIFRELVASNKSADDVISDIPTLATSELQLRMKTASMILAKSRLESVLDNQNLENVMVLPIDANEQQYAFMCTIDTFGDIYDQIKGQNDEINLILSQPDTGIDMVVTNATKEQAISLACEANPTMQVGLAMSYIPVNHIASVMENVDQKFARDILKAYALFEPELSGIRVLGPETKTNTENSLSANDTSVITTDILKDKHSSLLDKYITTEPEDETLDSKQARLVAVILNVWTDPPVEEEMDESIDTETLIEEIITKPESGIELLQKELFKTINQIDFSHQLEGDSGFKLETPAIQSNN